MRMKATNLLGVLAALSIGGTAFAVGCSGTSSNNTQTGGSGGATDGGSGGSGNGTASGKGGEGGDGGSWIPGGGGNDGGLDPDSACAAQSAEATLAKKPVDIIIMIDNSGSMTTEIQGVEKNINQNFAQIIESSGIDYRVILIARHGPAAGSQSICVEAPLSGIPAGGCASPPAKPVETSKFYHFNIEVASHNSLCLALQYFNMPDLDGDAGWGTLLRPDSFKAFIEITDDGVSCSYGGTTYNDGDTVAGGVTVGNNWDKALLTLSPEHFGTDAARNYAFYSIVAMGYNNPMTAPWLPSDPISTQMCPTAADPGTGYQQLSILTNALRFPMCDTTAYDVVFQAIAAGVIAGSKVACDFAVPDAPPGQTVDIKTVEVEYTPGGIGNPTGLKKVTDAASCGPDSFYIDEAAKHVYLCPDTCGVVQKDEKAKIDVLFACEIGGAN